MEFNKHLPGKREVYEPNPLNRQDGMQPNATGFTAYFSTSERKQAFAMSVLEVLSSQPG